MGRLIVLVDLAIVILFIWIIVKIIQSLKKKGLR